MSAQHSHGGGLSGAVGTEKTEYLSFPYVETDMIYGSEGAKAFGEVSHRYGNVTVGHFV